MAVQAVDKGAGGARKVPQQLKDLGAMLKPNPPTLGRCRMLLLARSAHGKSNFLGSNPDMCLLDFNGGAHSLLRQQACVIPITGYEHYTDTLAMLKTLKDEKQCPYTMIGFDTGQEWIELLARQVVSEWNEIAANKVESIGEIGQAGWGRLYSRVDAHLAQVYEAGFGWVVTAHLIDEKITIAGEEQYVTSPAMWPKMQEKFRREPELRCTLRKINDEVQEYDMQERFVGTGAQRVKKIIKVPKGPPKPVTRFTLDCCSTDDPRIGGSRVKIDEAIELPTYDVENKNGPTMWSALASVYDAARTRTIEQWQ